jgi:hypothetical protein
MRIDPPRLRNGATPLMWDGCVVLARYGNEYVTWAYFPDGCEKSCDWVHYHRCSIDNAMNDFEVRCKRGY